ncbi:Putative phosphoserine phosphatase 2 [Pseudoruegeria aquimaris]|uniref:Putative phosphoserine phosphatase 2 n=1 Tax=Pseudoruegeria aquimaris TaxID=393663 RepID=A0A1Y5SPR1_9RHOB|nr:histidine phosphatase family protein [Pseudoruegeria aquimaris]SLN45456.1 Putative phosphoserine phosphatase 2 [Pseudoruegeria aquimaris]
MIRFWWVRHGPTHETAFTGWRDVPADLSDTALIRRVSETLPAAAPVISSDLSRAVATADAIAGARPRLPHRAGLREFDFGDWDGKHWREVAESHPELSRAYWERPGEPAPPGGESWNAAAARIDAEIDALRKAPPAADIIIVAHFGTILTQVRKGLGVTPYEALAHRIDNLSITRIEVDGDGWRAPLINHLP